MIVNRSRGPKRLTVEQQRQILQMHSAKVVEEDIVEQLGVRLYQVRSVIARGDIVREHHAPDRCQQCGYMVYISPCIICERLAAEDRRREASIAARRAAKQAALAGMAKESA